VAASSSLSTIPIPESSFFKNFSDANAFASQLF
jgi:hypothetical protein